jgi:futalosine hydrolase
VTAGPVLIVTAVAPERDAVVRGLGLGLQNAGRIGPYDAILGAGFTVLAAGVGPAAAAAATATALSLGKHLNDHQYSLVVSAGIGGGFAGRSVVGEVVEATAIVAADLGAQTADGFKSVAALGFGSVEISAAELGIKGALRGPIFTVSTVTGTAQRAQELAARGGFAEAMEGFGVAEAAVRYGVPVGELRAISNAVGLRDRASWDIPGALAALTEAVQSLSA